MNIPDAVPDSVVRMTDSVPPVRVSIALMHTVTIPSVSFTVYMTGSNPTRVTAINNRCILTNLYMSIKCALESVSSHKYFLYIPVLSLMETLANVSVS